MITTPEFAAAEIAYRTERRAADYRQGRSASRPRRLRQLPSWPRRGRAGMGSLARG